MSISSNITAGTLGAVVLVGVYYSGSSELLEFTSDETIVAAAANIILIYFILALLIERACEVVMDVLTATGVITDKKPTDGNSGSIRRVVSLMICLLFATAIVLAGLRLVEMILNAATATKVTPEGYFATMDALLTALILAGGSEGVHQILRPLLGDKTPVLPDPGNGD